ncbi:hypothetical protein FRACYDRAFT_269710 [Fragilariopsis cylindrus CCMP1102]|uniref:Uncharacterized protein n=1 Tax=Fragilariopsis cylindrus CCMP1102 TaxID=635003 RepID=A0A1E7FA60_9STRA|nr:hypothetical protein FRACYDRAFT_269710 [Fragilariopsis cylindrus CCMP1102]|eukprot:OEU14915.1 hypothetical protein FRACYDRAFT_269710 [Fragilariopsis cylindrus CCMP1102]
MGRHKCVNCDNWLDVHSPECENCGYGPRYGAWVCDSCATAGGCDRCGESMCFSCVYQKFLCCGQVLCGVDDPSDKNCAGKHTEKTLKCGHTGCNFQKEDDGCRTCNIIDEANVEKDAIAEDIITIKSVMGRIKSKSIKSALESMIKDHEGNKRKRLDK